MLVPVDTVRLLLERAGIGRAVDFSADRPGELLNSPEAFVLSHEAGGHAVGFSLQRHRREFDLELRIVDAQQQLVGFDRGRSLCVVAEQVYRGLLLIVIDGELDVISAPAPVRERSSVRGITMAVPLLMSCIGCGLPLGGQRFPRPVGRLPARNRQRMRERRRTPKRTKVDTSSSDFGV